MDDLARVDWLLGAEDEALATALHAAAISRESTFLTIRRLPEVMAWVQVV